MEQRKFAEGSAINSQHGNLVTVVIVSWNSGPHLKRCLTSLAAQTYSKFSTVLIDNNSEQFDPQDYAPLLANLTIVRLVSNTGFAKANNLGIKEYGASKWVSLLNPDAFPEPDWLEKLLAVAENRTDYTFFGCHMLQDSDTLRIDGTGDIYHVSGLVWRRQHGHLASNQNNVEADEIFSPCAAAALYRRDALIETNGFDEDFFCYIEDADLGFRLQLLGHKALYVPEAVVRHVGSATTIRGSDFSVYHGHRNLVWTYVKNMPSVLFWLCLPAHIALNFAAVIWFSLNGQARVIWRAKYDALKELPIVWKKRRVIQATRRAQVMQIWRMLSKKILAGNRFQ